MPRTFTRGATWNGPLPRFRSVQRAGSSPLTVFLGTRAKSNFPVVSCRAKRYNYRRMQTTTDAIGMLMAEPLDSLLILVAAPEIYLPARSDYFGAFAGARRNNGTHNYLQLATAVTSLREVSNSYGSKISYLVLAST